MLRANGTYSRNLGHHLILARKSTFYEKGHLFEKRAPTPPIQSRF